MNIFIAHINGNTAELTPDESWHCSRVLRKKAGDEINLIDGLGHFFEARLELVSDKKCTASILSGPTAQDTLDYYLHLAIAPTKNIDRIEWMLEKAVEIGVHEISFFVAKNSERTSLKEERVRNIVESAVKQSLQARIPKINGLRPFNDVLRENEVEQKFIAHCYDGEKTDVRSVLFKKTKTLILIGPEGDFTNQEVELAEKIGFKGLSLGKNRLRTETAGLYVCQAASLLDK